MSGNSSYTVNYAVKAKQDITLLDSSVKKHVRLAIEKKLMINPVHFGKPLRYSLSGLRRLRVGNWRIIFKIIEAEKTVNIIAIKHRKDAYE